MKPGGLHWTLCFLLWTGTITAAGAALGALLFPLGGWLFHVERSAGQLAWQGIQIGSFYCFIWAPGTALVLCVMRAYRRRHPEAR